MLQLRNHERSTMIEVRPIPDHGQCSPAARQADVTATQMLQLPAAVRYLTRRRARPRVVLRSAV